MEMSNIFDYTKGGYSETWKEEMGLWYLQKSEMDDEMYCSNSACDLNIPTRQVFADPFASRMSWKAKNGKTKHFCATCAKAVAIWYEEGR
jgi:hypothetical protein